MIIQDSRHQNLVLEALAELLAEPVVERVRGAVAYANVEGVRALNQLLEVLDDSVPVALIVTLDMGITRKAALEILLNDFRGTVKVIETSPGDGTFHSKAWVVDRTAAAQRALVGSANLTGAALTKNREAVSLGDLDDAQSQAWEVWWDEAIAETQDLTEAVIAGYEERRPPPGRRQRIADVDMETSEDGVTVRLNEATVVDARSAGWLAIDWGGTGEFRVQFEFPRAAASFFDPEHDPQRDLTLQSGAVDFPNNQLRFYPDNGMVRINMDPEIPEVADGSIRSGTWLFKRLGPDHYEMKPLTREERTARLAEAALIGGVRSTPNRDYGWA